MHATLRYFANFLWYASLSVVVILAAYVGLGRQFFPAISLYQEEIQAKILEQTGLYLRIGEIEGRWDGLNPIIEFRAIQKLDSTGSQDAGFHLKSLTIEIAAIESLSATELRIDDLRVSGIVLNGRQHSDGHWSLVGFDSSSADTSETSFSTSISSIFNSYLVHPYLEVSDISLQIENQAGHSYELNVPKAQLVFDQEELSARGEVVTPELQAPFAQFAFEGKGQPGSDDFEAVFFVDWAIGEEFEQYLQAYNWRGLEVAKLEANGRLWFTFSQGELQEIASLVNIPEMLLSNETQTLSAINNVDFSVRWKNSPDQHLVVVENLNFEWQGHTWGNSQYEWFSNARRQRFRGTSINLDILTPLLISTGVLTGEGLQSLIGYNPLGALNNIDLSIVAPPTPDSAGQSDQETLSEDTDSQLHIAANLKEVSVSAFDGAPSGSGINGLFLMENGDGSVQFASDHFTMGFPNLFLEAWAFRYAEGTVKWQSGDALTEIFSDGLILDYSAGGRVFGDFRLSLPDTPYDRYLSLNIAPNGIPASHTTKFIPYHAVSHGLYDWLDHAIVGGHVTKGVYIGHGAVGDGDPEGLFESAMYFDVTKGEINFDDEWPNVTGYEGRVSVDPTMLTVTMEKGKLGRLDVSGALVEKQLLTRDGESTPVNVSLKKTLTGKEADYAMTQLPIREHTGEVASALDIEGDVALSLDLALAIDDDLESRHKVGVTLPGNTVGVPGADLRFEKVKGQLIYDSWKGISGAIDVSVLGNTGQIIAQSDFNDQSRSTRVLLNSSAQLASIEHWLGLEKLYGLSGEMDYTALLEVNTQGSETLTTLDIRSDLLDIASTWPDFLHKKAGEPLSLRYRKILSDSVEHKGGFCAKGTEPVKDCFELEGVLHGWRVGEGSENQSTTISLMDESVPLVSEPGIWLKGYLQALNVDTWKTFVEGLLEDGKQASGASDSISGAELTIGQLDAYGQLFSNQHVVYQPELDGSRMVLSGNELAGTVWAPSDETVAIDINLSRLVLMSEQPHEILSDSASQFESETLIDNMIQQSAAFDLSGVKDIDIKITDLHFDDYSFDEFGAQLRVEESTLTVFPLRVRVQDDVVDGHLRWYIDPVDASVSRTLFSGSVLVTGLDERWQALGNEPVIDSKKGTLEYTLTWPGSPIDFGLSALSGRAQVKLSEGKIYQKNASANVLKLFGILNLDTLTRRLKLDFSDLTDKGISFDSLEATGAIQNGLLTLEDPLIIQGPSNVFKFTGNTNLVSETLDLEMTLVLPLTQNLPLAALFVGAPVVGGGLWVVDKLIGDPLSDILSATYLVKGTWGEPKVELKTVFNNGKSKEKNAPSTASDPKQDESS